MILAPFERGVLCILTRKISEERHKLGQLRYTCSPFEEKLACSLCVGLRIEINSMSKLDSVSKICS